MTHLCHPAKPCPMILVGVLLWLVVGMGTAWADDLCMFAENGVVTISNQQAGSGQKIACYKKEEPTEQKECASP